MTEALWITVASLIISIATFVYAAVFNTRSNRTDGIEGRLLRCEEQCAKCLENEERLMTENIRLMRRINTLMDDVEK